MFMINQTKPSSLIKKIETQLLDQFEVVIE